MFVKIVCASVGIGYVLIGAMQLFLRRTFFTVIGPIAPYNPHYIGDLGSFVFPIGIGLLLAARNPAQHRLLLGVAAAASTLHALNHLLGGATSSGDRLTIGALGLVGAALVAITFVAREERATA